MITPKYLQPLDEMKRITRQELADNFDEILETVEKDNVGYVIKDTEGKNDVVLCPERVFADAKEKHAMRYTPYRGLAQVSNWVRLKFAAMNLKKFAKRKWRDNHPSDFLLFFSLFDWLHSKIQRCPES